MKSFIDIRIEDSEFRWYVKSLIKNNPKFKNDLMRALSMRCRKRVKDLLIMGNVGYWNKSTHNTSSLVPHLHWGKNENKWSVYFDDKIAGKSGSTYSFKDLASWVEGGTKKHFIPTRRGGIDHPGARPKRFFSQGVKTFENFDLNKITMNKIKKFYERGNPS